MVRLIHSNLGRNGVPILRPCGLLREEEETDKVPRKRRLSQGLLGVLVAAGKPLSARELGARLDITGQRALELACRLRRKGAIVSLSGSPVRFALPKPPTPAA